MSQTAYLFVTVVNYFLRVVLQVNNRVNEIKFDISVAQNSK